MRLSENSLAIFSGGSAIRQITASLLLQTEAMVIYLYNKEHDEKITITFISVEVLYSTSSTIR